MKVKTEVLGRTPQGSEVEQYTLMGDRSLRIRLMTYGATILAVEVPDRAGRVENVTLHLDTLDDYLAGHPHLGSIAGRFANRISKGRFCLDGREYRLETNNGPNHLHGGRDGFDKKVWLAEPAEGDEYAEVRMTLVSPDGDEGYPGALTATIAYSLCEDEFRMEYLAETDRPTVINLTNHAYWNLAGGGTVLDHELTLYASRYLPVDADLIPTGERASVEGTPMDFRTPRRLGERIGEVGLGYDHCFEIDEPPGTLRLAARLVDPASGRSMEVHTTQPAVQIYTANYLTDRHGARGRSYGPHQALCLETQHFPDSPNQPAFPSTVLRPGEKYHEVTVHRFGIDS